MITLHLTREPQWFDLGHGVEVYAVPCSAAVMMAARALVARAPADVPSDPAAAALARAEATADLVKAVGAVAIRDWRGVAGPDGEPAMVSREAIAALLDLHPLNEAFQVRYMGPHLLVAAEKNASAPSSSGTSAAANPIAQPVPSAAPSAPTP